MANHIDNGESVMYTARRAGPTIHKKQIGFTYLGILFATALISIGLTAISEVWTKRADREKITQVNWIGLQYVNAIRSYYYSNTGSVHFYPAALEDLLEDKRYLSIKRHLRSSYKSPIESTLVSIQPTIGPSGGINGVTISVQISESISNKHDYIFTPETISSKQ